CGPAQGVVFTWNGCWLCNQTKQEICFVSAETVIFRLRFDLPVNLILTPLRPLHTCPTSVRRCSPIRASKGLLHKTFIGSPDIGEAAHPEKGVRIFNCAIAPQLHSARLALACRRAATEVVTREVTWNGACFFDRQTKLGRWSSAVWKLPLGDYVDDERDG